MYKDAIFRSVDLEAENRELAKVVAAQDAASMSLAEENDRLKIRLRELESEVARTRIAPTRQGSDIG